MCFDTNVLILTYFIFSGSSVCSNTPSLVGENLESFSLGESEKVPGSGATDKKDTNAWAINTALVQVQAPPLRRSLFSNVPPTMNFVHHNEVSVIFFEIIYSPGLDVSNLGYLFGFFQVCLSEEPQQKFEIHVLVDELPRTLHAKYICFLEIFIFDVF